MEGAGEVAFLDPQWWTLGNILSTTFGCLNLLGLGLVARRRQLGWLILASGNLTLFTFGILIEEAAGFRLFPLAAAGIQLRHVWVHRHEPWTLPKPAKRRKARHRVIDPLASSLPANPTWRPNGDALPASGPAGPPPWPDDQQQRMRRTSPSRHPEQPRHEAHATTACSTDAP